MTIPRMDHGRHAAAFVSDLQPVVGNSAVAFDPTVSVITDGTFLRVIDAWW